MTARTVRKTRSHSVTLALTGDVMLGRLMNDAIHAYGPLYPWGNTLTLLRSADMALVNLECVIASDDARWTPVPKVFHFRADPVALQVLEVAGIDAVSLANNHVLDYGAGAMVEMLARLDAAGIVHAGAGRNLDEAEQPARLKPRGINVAVISFTDNEPTWAATATSPGINFVPVDLTSLQFARLKRSIGTARRNGADIVLVSAHWGPNMRQRPTPSFKAFAHQVIDAGCDIFHGHSAHILQGIEIYKGKPILYDTGDFVDDYAVDEQLRNDQSALFRLEISAAGVHHLDIFPTLIRNFQANLAVGEDFRQIASRLGHLCREMGTKVTVMPEQLRVIVQPYAAGGRREAS